MAAIALPLRELSAKAQREAVSAKIAYWSLAEELEHRRIQLVVWTKTRTLNHAMGRLVENQESLIDHLSKAPTQQFRPETFFKIAADLSDVVSLTNSFVDDAYDMPPECLNVWSERLGKIADLNSHLDNFAESFRVASDETCSALLADMARTIMVSDSVPIP
jgi:hypothetical protein